MTDIAHLRDIVRDFEQDRVAGPRDFAIGGFPDDPAIVQTATPGHPERVVITFRHLVRELLEHLDRVTAEREALASRLGAAEERWREEAALRADLQKAIADAPARDDTADRWIAFLGSAHRLTLVRLSATEVAVEVRATPESDPVSFATSDLRNLPVQFAAAFPGKAA